MISERISPRDGGDTEVATKYQRVRAEVRAQIRARLQNFRKSRSRLEFPSAVHECVAQLGLQNDTKISSQIILVAEKIRF